jgi:HSP20 family protein
MEKRESKEVTKAEPSLALSPVENMARWFEDVFRRPFSLTRPLWWPHLKPPELEEMTSSVDIFEDGENVVVKAELPGMKKEDIEISLKDDILTISGEKKREEKVEKKNYYKLERSYGSVIRTFRLPTQVQTDRAKAKFENGVLEIKVPKTEEAKKKEKKISIG